MKDRYMDKNKQYDSNDNEINTLYTVYVENPSNKD